ncbi:MAG: hypothetical protein M1834_009761 [Cirrosporium novae-zelandiae]|nr:MAG: hypothetical protein M1834_009761 [Cirrosporium novae-zelandiae]
MSTASEDDTHLLQEKLTNPIIQPLLEEFGAWVKDANFGPGGGDIEICRDDGLNKAFEPLRDSLGLFRKFGKCPFGWTVLRIIEPFQAGFKHENGVACIIPIRIWGGNPAVRGAVDPQIARGTISPHKLLIPGWITHMTKAVKITPGLDCLFLVQL